jgi:hypothetical protein
MITIIDFQLNGEQGIKCRRKTSLSNLKWDAYESTIWRKVFKNFVTKTKTAYRLTKPISITTRRDINQDVKRDKNEPGVTHKLNLKPGDYIIQQGDDLFPCFEEVFNECYEVLP